VVAHVFADVGPHRQQHALAFVVAGTVLVRRAEVAGHDRAVYGADDLTEGDVARRVRQHVAAAHTTLGANQSRSFESEQNLFKIGLGKTRALRYVAH
jgi:hypothetical protein